MADVYPAYVLEIKLKRGDRWGEIARVGGVHIRGHVSGKLILSGVKRDARLRWRDVSLWDDDDWHTKEPRVLWRDDGTAVVRIPVSMRGGGND